MRPHAFNGETDKWTGIQIASTEEIAINKPLDSYDKGEDWVATVVGANVDIAAVEGDVAGAGYLRCTLDPTKPGQSFSLIGRDQFRIPATVDAPITLSARQIGYSHTFDLLQVGDDGLPVTNGTLEPVRPITSNIVVSSNVATITMAAGHTLKVGDLIEICCCQDSRMNICWTPVVSVVSDTVITCALTIGNATYTVGAAAVLKEFRPDYQARNCFGLVMGGAQTANQGQAYARTGGSGLDITAASTLTTSYTVATAPSGYAGAYTNAQSPTCFTRLNVKQQGGHVQTQSVNSASVGASIKLNRTVPNLERKYAYRFTGKAHDNICVPVGGGIASIAKAGSTTCTIVFNSAHGLTTSDYVTIYGVRDQTNFINTTTAVVVSSVVSPTSITVLIAGTGTATSYGGQVMKMNGNNTVTMASSSIQSVACTVAGRLTVTYLASPGTHLVGERFYLGGIEMADGSGTFATAGWAEGMYELVKNDTATFIQEFTVPGLEAFASVNVGGTGIKAIDFNIKFVRVEAYNRSQVELVGAGVSGGLSDANENPQVTVLSAPTTTVILTPSASSGGYSSTHHLIGANTTNATSVKSSAGTIGLITLSNINAAVRYFKLYNKASAPTVGSDTPVMTVAIPSNGTLSIEPSAGGLRLATGIAYALTTGIAVADTGAVAAAEQTVHISYI